MKKLIALILLLGIGGGGYYYWRSQNTEAPRFRTATVERGDLVVTINATGTVEPVDAIDVGAQVAGKIETFGTDTAGNRIDFGSQVEENMVLAHIDDTLYAADVQGQQAQVHAAEANFERAKAELVQSQAQLRQAQRDWDRAKKLATDNPSAIAALDLDMYQSKVEIAEAGIGVSKASIEQANKAIELAKTALNRAKSNWSYCTIKSPVKGVVIARRVNIGQTVVASLNAPSVFLIAKDLRNMQVWVAVNEADIGHIYLGQPVSFTVDAFQGEKFQGTVSKIRLDASMTQNVVTYTVEVNTDNSNLRLLPYLSATVKFELQRYDDTLQVPNMALNWTPSTDVIAPDALADALAAQKNQKGKDSKNTTTKDSNETTGDHGKDKG
ncbi:MAG: efflux RND transporter periplasmic adaptor subunit, partial [Phycisphaerae bacterium]|nr:efflux RND transporter periplasmic adaptor subunit [Phycisphaerae bacterium]